MLVKLFKYEFKALGRKLIPFYLLALVIALINSVFTSFTRGSDILRDYSMLAIAYGIMVSLFVLSLIGLSIFTFIVIVQRFSRNMLGKEGYLMHTLPVSVPQHIFVKTVTTAVFYIIDMAVCIIAMIMFSAGMGADFSELLKDITQNINPIPPRTYILLMNVAVMLILGTINSILGIYTAMSIGYTSNSHKIASSIGVYVIIYIIKNAISQVLVQIMMPAMANNTPPTVGAAAYFKFLNLWFMGINVFLIVIIAVLAAVCCYFVKNKLNLE